MNWLPSMTRRTTPAGGVVDGPPLAPAADVPDAADGQRGPKAPAGGALQPASSRGIHLGVLTISLGRGGDRATGRQRAVKAQNRVAVVALVVARVPLSEELESGGGALGKRRIGEPLLELFAQRGVAGEQVLGDLLGDVVFEVFLLFEDAIKKPQRKKRVRGVRFEELGDERYAALGGRNPQRAFGRAARFGLPLASTETVWRPRRGVGKRAGLYPVDRAWTTVAVFTVEN